MRLGVLDIGSNTGHLLVVDVHVGAAPLPASSHKESLRLAEHIDDTGAISQVAIDALTRFVTESLEMAADKGCHSVFSFATSAIRDAVNGDDVLEHIQQRTGAEIQVLPGEDEARLTFLAVRRWFGWSSGRLGVFDIGGGSLEISAGAEENPDIAHSLPLGAARLTRTHLGAAPPAESAVAELRLFVRSEIARDAGGLLRAGPLDHAVATSRTFRSLARICGAAPEEEGPYVRRILRADDLESWIPKIAVMTNEEIANLPGTSTDRAHQVLAGALVASAVMDIFDLPELEICPWALREGILLKQLDLFDDA